MKNLAKILNFAIIGLMVVALIMMFLPAVKAPISIVTNVKTYSGLNVIFGYTEKGTYVSNEIFKFSIMNLVTYLLVIVTAVLTALQLGKKKQNNLFTYLATGSALVAAILFLLTKNLTVVSDSYQEFFQAGGTTFAKFDYVELCAGPIIGAICAFLAAGCGIVKSLELIKKR